MTEPKWTRVTHCRNVPVHEGRSIKLGELELALFNLGGRFAAVENRCPHEGGPLCDGIVSGATVVCPLHGWRFDLETGFAVRASAPARVRTFPTRVEDGIVLVATAGDRIEPEEPAA